MQLNGEPATADDLRALAGNNYGHFTALRVRDGAAIGLDLHLDRLAFATRALFDAALDCAKVQLWMRQAVAGMDGEISLRATVFSRAFDRAHPGASAAPDVLIVAAPTAPTRPAPPLRLQSVAYVREFPEIKHIGTFPLFRWRAVAQSAGADDALFVSADGLVAEASIWNIGFWDGSEVIWPQAPQLVGTGMRLLQRGLAELGIRSRTHPVALRDVARFHAAFLSNASVPVQPVAAIDRIAFERFALPLEMLQAAFARNVPQVL